MVVGIMAPDSLMCRLHKAVCFKIIANPLLTAPRMTCLESLLQHLAQRLAKHVFCGLWKAARGPYAVMGLKISIIHMLLAGSRLSFFLGAQIDDKVAATCSASIHPESQRRRSRMLMLSCAFLDQLPPVTAATRSNSLTMYNANLRIIHRFP